MTTQRTGLATGWKILWGTLAAVSALFLAAAVYVIWALGNTNWG